MSLPLTLPLRGSQLIEASAGTGKTYTIALLYIRLILGPRVMNGESGPDETAFHRPLLPPEILVVTFTEAATQELRMRIRERLMEAARAFRADPQDTGADTTDPLLQLRDACPPDSWPGHARSLQVAAEWMDEAAVSTIHAWALRMLKEHAFDSGNQFHQELVSDQTTMLRDAVNDYWRERFYPLEEPAARIIRSVFRSPEALGKALATPLRREHARLVHAGRPAEAADLAPCLEAASAAQQDSDCAEGDARAAYRADAATVRGLLEGLRPGLHRSSYKEAADDEAFAAALASLDAWAQDTAAANAFVGRLAPRRMRLRKGYSCPDHPFFRRLDHWQQCLESANQARGQLRSIVLADARVRVRERLEQQLAERSEMGFDDLLRRLDHALHSPRGDALAERIRTQFPVALVDEFQDTDPLQYRIFDRVYRVADDDRNCCLVLIGDPKQAIYSFRGADIHSYLEARRATAGRHHTLRRNFRSSRGMVEAVNCLFQQAEAFPRGAFRFRRDGGNPLPFVTVDARGREERLVLEDSPATALTAWLYQEEEAVSVDTFRAVLAEHAAQRITAWLNGAGSSRTGFVTGSGHRPLAPGDIAVLVRNHTEAAAIRGAMHRRGLASVYLSDKDSVFASREAADLLTWLRACAEPDDDGLLRTALATGSLALPLAELDRVRHDELAWERYQERFYGYHQDWRRLGTLPMLRRLIQEFDVAGKALSRADGERRMTNLLHLAEWAQEAADSLDGPQALVRLLSEHVRDPSGEDQVLRLESDAELIQVVTIHKAKGLEYPLVVVPFATSWREVSGGQTEVVYHDDGMYLEVAGKDKAADAYARADDERLDEDVRLLYVALTRARHATFLGLAPVAPGSNRKAQLHKSAIGYLLAGGEQLPDARTLEARLTALCGICGELTVEPVPGEAGRGHYRPATARAQFRPARPVRHGAFEPWWIASYSALETGTSDGVPETPREDTRNETSAERGPADRDPPGGTPAAGSIHAFPRGPEAGTFLHGLMEWAAHRGFGSMPAADERRRQIERRCRARHWQTHAVTLDHWLETMLQAPLFREGNAQQSLAGLTAYQVEREFWFAVSHADARDLDRLIQEHILPGELRPALTSRHLNGLLKGFIDLVAEHNGRYFVLDWKSNHLGADNRYYTTGAMQQAMLDNRYDVQFSLYLLALHRHLRQRLGTGYDYDRHVGGAMLVFVRGIDSPGHGLLHQLPARTFMEQLDGLMGTMDQGGSPA